MTDQNEPRNLSQRLYFFSDDDVKKLEALCVSQPELQRLLENKKAFAIIMSRIGKIVGWVTIIVTVVTMSDEIRGILSNFLVVKS